MSARPPDRRSVTVGLVVAGLMVACCALPALIAAGALGALGAVVGNPFLVGAAVVLAALAVGRALWRHHRQDRGNTCGPPADRRPW
ncbi:hypothetical protein GCM10012275_10350 [Longimycelium tulufanense]|uniref:Mercuric ion transport protein n=1 Tax=Longimycelium tulufanense TaxID=907463 RepID=A0A8J3C8L8_9PSEU|nr:hypothetical protein [Longimycelium tulufanense]GGM41265.1 hypothetical protein GCM10012275_10350 [Longimycelium tulufanense]